VLLGTHISSNVLHKFFENKLGVVETSLSKIWKWKFSFFIC